MQHPYPQARKKVRRTGAGDRGDPGDVNGVGLRVGNGGALAGLRPHHQVVRVRFSLLRQAT